MNHTDQGYQWCCLMLAWAVTTHIIYQRIQRGTQLESAVTIHIIYQSNQRGTQLESSLIREMIQALGFLQVHSMYRLSGLLNTRANLLKKIQNTVCSHNAFGTKSAPFLLLWHPNAHPSRAVCSWWHGSKPSLQSCIPHQTYVLKFAWLGTNKAVNPKKHSMKCRTLLIRSKHIHIHKDIIS